MLVEIRYFFLLWPIQLRFSLPLLLLILIRFLVIIIDSSSISGNKLPAEGLEITQVHQGFPRLSLQDDWK